MPILAAVQITCVSALEGAPSYVEEVARAVGKPPQEVSAIEAAVAIARASPADGKVLNDDRACFDVTWEALRALDGANHCRRDEDCGVGQNILAHGPRCVAFTGNLNIVVPESVQHRLDEACGHHHLYPTRETCPRAKCIAGKCRLPRGHETLASPAVGGG